MRVDGDVIMALMNMRHPKKPSAHASGGGVPDCLWSLLLKCWSQVPGDRPSASGILEAISSLAFVDEFSPWFDNMVRSRSSNVTSESKHSGKASTRKSARMSLKYGPFYLRPMASWIHSKGKQSLVLVQDQNSLHRQTASAVRPVIGSRQGTAGQPSSPVFNVR